MYICPMSLARNLSYRLVNRYFPALLWKKAKQTKYKNKKHILILDCDTDLDIKVVWTVHERLKTIGIKPIYAVPGEMLLKGLDVYTKIRNEGFEFINHGFKQHTVVDDERLQYKSTFFYSNISKNEIYDDVRKGDETLRNSLDYSPITFRTPHFGTFESKRNLKFIHLLLKDLNYKYSSSSGPFVFFKKGNKYLSHKIIELPVSGSSTWPLVIPDTYTFRFANNSRFTQEQYEKELNSLFEKMENSEVIKLNFYADPSQIHDWKNFFHAQSNFAKYNVGTVKEYEED
jgi:hypothetical protein